MAKMPAVAGGLRRRVKAKGTFGEKGKMWSEMESFTPVRQP